MRPTIVICEFDDVVRVVFGTMVMSHQGEQQRAQNTALGDPSVHSDVFFFSNIYCLGSVFEEVQHPVAQEGMPSGLSKSPVHTTSHGSSSTSQYHIEAPSGLAVDSCLYWLPEQGCAQ